MRVRRCGEMMRRIPISDIPPLNRIFYSRAYIFLYAHPRTDDELRGLAYVGSAVASRARVILHRLIEAGYYSRRVRHPSRLELIDLSGLWP